MRPPATASREAGGPAEEPGEGAAPAPGRARGRLSRPCHLPGRSRGPAARRVLCPEPGVFGALLCAPPAEITPFRRDRGLPPAPPALPAGPQPPPGCPSEARRGSRKPCFPRGRLAGFSAGGRGGGGEARLRWQDLERKPIPPVAAPLQTPSPSPRPPPPPCRGAAAEPDPGIDSPPECRRSSCSSRWFHALPFSQSLTLWSQPARCNHPALLQVSDGQQEKSPKARPSRKPALRRGGGCRILL